MDAARKHQIKIAKDTLKMDPAMVAVMGGMSRREALDTLREEGLLPLKSFTFIFIISIDAHDEADARECMQHALSDGEYDADLNDVNSWSLRNA